MKRTPFVSALLALVTTAMLWTHAALATQTCSVDTDCKDNGAACGTDTCDPVSNVCVAASSSAYSSCMTASDCKCPTTCVGAEAGSGLTAASPGHCGVVTRGSGGSSSSTGCGCSLAGHAGDAASGWEGAAALGSLGLLLLRLLRAPARSPHFAALFLASQHRSRVAALKCGPELRQVR